MHTFITCLRWWFSTGFATAMEDPETGQAPVRPQETIIVVPKKSRLSFYWLKVSIVK